MSACLTWMVSVGLIGSLVLCPVYGDPEQIKAKPGEDVPLQCRGSKDAMTVMLRWSRPDLKSEGYVFYFRDHRTDEEAQHESFHARVDLRDPEMKDGDFSVILKNVRISDTGSYECYVGTKGNRPKLINSIKLEVEYPDQKEKTVKPGENVVLQCQDPTDAEIVMFRWVRPDLKSEDYVSIFKDGRLDENSQHEAFRGRVELRDPEMKDGDVSVILKNVRISDTGSYECYVGKKKPGSVVPEPAELINSITLKVEDSGHTGGHKDEGDMDGGDQGGHVGLTAGLLVVGILLLVAAVVGFMFYRKRSRPTDQNPNPRPEQTPMNPK